jgi:ubiquinone/menaquinone biosynthesis C-methylase UbiE
MHNNLTPVLDVCCGSKAFWFNKNDPRAIFLDIRNETIQADKRKGRKPIEIKPTYMANFQNIPFPDDTFHLVVFDPPHVTAAQTGCVLAYYGVLDDNWREMLRNGFSECFRVLKPNGTLIFKWAETKIPVSEILKLTPEKPLFGHKSGKLSKTHWITFTKPNNACSGLAPAGASDGQISSGASR